MCVCVGGGGGGALLLHNDRVVPPNVFRCYPFPRMAFPKTVPISMKYFPGPYPFSGNKIYIRVSLLRDVPWELTGHQKIN